MEEKDKEKEVDEDGVEGVEEKEAEKTRKRTGQSFILFRPARHVLSLLLFPQPLLSFFSSSSPFSYRIRY